MSAAMVSGKDAGGWEGYLVSYLASYEILVLKDLSSCCPEMEENAWRKLGAPA